MAFESFILIIFKFFFFQLLKTNDLEFKVTYQFLKPILQLGLSSKLLLEAVESSADTKVIKFFIQFFFFSNQQQYFYFQVNAPEVIKEILPKINVHQLPLNGIEILLKYCETLKSVKLEHSSIKLKTSLEPKVFYSAGVSASPHLIFILF